MVRLDRAEQGLGVSCEIGEAFQSRMKYSSECRLLLNCGGPGSVIYTKSGGMHGIRNVGKSDLKFVAFLYHST